MRKRNIEKLFDVLFWFLVYILPVLGYCLYLSQVGAGVITDFGTFLEDFGVSVTSYNVVYECLNDIFGAGGIMPLFGNGAILSFGAYFVSCVLVHLCIDVLLFIPRIAHKWIDKMIGGCANE